MNPLNPMFLTEAQLKAEIARCEYCAEKPCQEGCPADCSPADFIMAVKVGDVPDYKRAAALIMGHNPLGGICGAVCPDRHCMRKCVHQGFDRALNIPAIQATIIQRAKELGVMPRFEAGPSNGRVVGVVGAGPAGIGAAAVLAQEGYTVRLWETGEEAGGMCGLIPDERLNKQVLKTDLDFFFTLGDIRLIQGRSIGDPATLLAEGCDAVLVTTGLDQPIRLGIPGEEAAIPAMDILRRPGDYDLTGLNVAVVGGGAVAVDCALVARSRGANRVELISLEKLGEMPLTQKEFEELIQNGFEVSGRTRVVSIRTDEKGRVAGLAVRRVELPSGQPFHPRSVQDMDGTDQDRSDIQAVILSIGSRSGAVDEHIPAVFHAGDLENGPTTVVEAVAAGKNAAREVDAFLRDQPAVPVERKVKSRIRLAGANRLPVPLEAEFFGKKIPSPFLLSAAPPTDGYEQMRKAYEAGWAGGVMKTAFDGVPIHIPAEYMFAFSPTTYANCDNVSGHSLERVCREVERLRREFPDRLTLASTGGPVTGNEDHDRNAWQSNTRKLEAAGVMGIEYSLSCPQGGDGTKGDIVSQDAELTAMIIDWILQAGDAEIPKLFKLTAAVTAIQPIITAIRAVLNRYPDKKAGVTLANTFPTLAFRKGAKAGWEEGVVVGMSGEGVTPISNLTLARVSRLGVVVSGNGGPMDYKSAAHFLALGARTVQFCTIVMKHGYGIVDELHSGLSHLLEARGIPSVEALIGRALPDPVTDFMALSAVKKVSAVHAELCQHCGNCTRCPYLAVSLNADKVPETVASRCIGCSICVQKCFSGALYMRERTPEEARALVEGGEA